MKKLFTFLLSINILQLAAQPGGGIPFGTVLPTRQTSVHDPVMIKQQETYYLFCTGFGISVWSSKDLKNWRKELPVFAKAPQWAVDTIPGFRGHMWAPDISYHNRQYYLYYSVSVFGKNTSAIGVATNKTLDPSSPDFKWVDHGRVIQSYHGKTQWNAIDPNLIIDANGTPYLAFGSFWEGLKMVRLKNDLLQVVEFPINLFSIASRKKRPSGESGSAADATTNNAGPNPIEAPFIFKKGDYYYLFASIDYCCQGAKSTYKVVVGRSKNVEGPYVDKEGNELGNGGGSIVLQGNKDWYGVGHNGIYSGEGKDFIIYHGYDATDAGKSKLLLQELLWDAAKWPFIKETN